MTLTGDSAMCLRAVLLTCFAAAATASVQQTTADVPPRSLWITVKQSTDRTTSAASGQVTATSETRHRGGVERRTTRTVTGSFGGTGSTESGTSVARLRALEGTRAFIQVGRAVPVPVTQVGPSGDLVRGATYEEADTGFYVVPRLSGDLVTLEILAEDDSENPAGGVDAQRVRTTVSGRLGEWISIGGIARSSSGRSASPFSATREQSAESRTFLLKVEEAR